MFLNDNVEVDESSIYLKKSLKEILPRALNEVCQTRPADPIEFLARCLYKAADCDMYFNEKAEFEAEKRMLEIQMRKEEQQRQNAMLRYKKQISEYTNFLHIIEGTGMSGVDVSKRHGVRSQSQSRPASRAGRKTSEGVKKEGRRRTKPYFAGRTIETPLVSTNVSVGVLAGSETRRGSSARALMDAGRKTPKKKPLLRKGILPVNDSRSVVSIQRDSRSSSRTLDEDVLERKSSPLTSSSRTVSRRVSYGDEWDMHESLAPSLELDVPEVTSKRDSSVRRKSRGKSKLVDDEEKPIRTRRVSLAGRKGEKSKEESSITDLTLSSSEVEGKSKLGDDYEELVGRKGQTRKKRRSINKIVADLRRDKFYVKTSADEQETEQSPVSKEVTPTRELENKFPEKMTLEEKRKVRLEARTLKRSKESEEAREKVRKTFKEKKTVDLKKAPTSDKKSDDLEPRKHTSSEEDIDSAGYESESDEWESDESSLARGIQDQPEADREQVTGDDDTEKEGSRLVSKKRRRRSKSKRMFSPATLESEDTTAFSEDSDQKRKGKVKIIKLRKKHVDDGEEKPKEENPVEEKPKEAKSPIAPQKRQIAANQHVDFDKLLTRLQKVRRRASAASKRSSNKEYPEGEEEEEEEEEEDEYEQESENADTQSISRKTIISDSKSSPSVKTRHRRLSRKSSKVSDGEVWAPPPSRNMSYDEFTRKRAGMDKSGKKGKHPTRRGSFSKKRRSLSESDSRRPSGQFSDLFLSETESADNLHDTSSRPFEARLTTMSTEEFTYPFTPVQCEWLLADSNTLVCRHPVLGDIRSRPPIISNALDIWAWSDRSNYNWRSIYDHEIYTVAEPFYDQPRVRQKHKS